MEESDFDNERKKLIRSLKVRFGKKINSVDIQTAVSEGFEAYLRVVRKGTLSLDETPYAYAHQSAYHAILKLLKRRAHERPISELTLEPGANDSEERTLEAEDMVHKIFEHLSEDYRKVLVSYNEGYEIEEIAEKMNRSVPAAYKLLERAKKRFYEVGIKLGIPPPPTKTGPNEIKINLRKIEIECRILRGIWPYTTSAIIHEELKRPRILRSDGGRRKSGERVGIVFYFSCKTMHKSLLLLALIIIISSCRSSVNSVGTKDGTAQPAEIYPASVWGAYGSMSMYHKSGLAYLYTALANMPGTNYFDSSSSSCIAEDCTLMHQYFIDSMGLTGSALTFADSSFGVAINYYSTLSSASLFSSVGTMPITARELSFINRCIAIDTTSDNTLWIMGKLDSIGAIWSDWQAVTNWDSVEGYDGHVSEGFIWVSGSSIDFWDELLYYYPSAPTITNPLGRSAISSSIIHSRQPSGQQGKFHILQPSPAAIAAADAIAGAIALIGGCTPGQALLASLGASVGSAIPGIGGNLLGGGIGVLGFLGGGGGGGSIPCPCDRDATYVWQ